MTVVIWKYLITFIHFSTDMLSTYCVLGTAIQLGYSKGHDVMRQGRHVNTKEYTLQWNRGVVWDTYGRDGPTTLSGSVHFQ